MKIQKNIESKEEKKRDKNTFFLSEVVQTV
jgi:hypothetical protein